MRHAAPVALITLTVALSHAFAWGGVFLFDDIRHIKAEHFETVGKALSYRITRPWWSLSMGVCYWVGDGHPWSFHLLNITAHAVNALLVYAVIILATARRGFALACGAIFAAHWLSVDAVTYITQRSESMAATGILAAVACALAWSKTRRPWWLVGILAACVWGVGFKPTALAAPIILMFVHHRLYGGGAARVYRRLPNLSTVMVAPMLWILWFQIPRLIPTGIDALPSATGTKIGFNAQPDLFAWWGTQCRAVVWYIRRSVWPEVVPVDPGFEVTSMADNWPAILAVSALVIYGAWALDRRKWSGVLIMGALVVLAITAIVPSKNAAWSYRAYLPSLAVIVGGCYLGAHLLRRWKSAQVLAVAVVVCLAARTTIQNNSLYRDPLVMWRAGAEYAPHHFRAWHNVGSWAHKQGRYREAVDAYYQALRIKPCAKITHRQLMRCLMKTKPPNLPAARFHYRNSRNMPDWG